MLPAILSLVALFSAIALSIFSQLNVGLLGLGLAYLLGAVLLGIPPKGLYSSFPSSLFLTLLGLTFLFGHARVNGTLDRLAGWAVQLTGGRIGLMPITFFGLAVLLGTMGAGNIGSVALLAPIAMEVAAELSIPPFLMALMVACGGNATAFSPIAPTGVIAASFMQRIGLADHAWHTYAQCLLAHVVFGFGGYLLFGGLRLLRDPPSAEQSERLQQILIQHRQPLALRHAATLLVLFGMLLLIARFRWDVGPVALGAALLLSLTRLGDERAALATIPWETILIVCGMSVLMSILERTGGIELCTRALSHLSTPRTAPGVMGLLTGALSAYSSSSSVVLPAFLPTIPGLIHKIGGGNALALADSVNIGAHLVDVSPLSTLGSLCVAACARDHRDRLYRQLLVWGMAMIVAGGVYCFVVFGLLR